MNNTCFQCFRDTLDEQGICTACGYDSAKNRERFPLALPEGSILYGQYIIGKVLGQGGFGITYLAQDYQTQALVAIKEFFPGAMATRTGTTVTPYSGVQGENFTYGRTTFLDEAKTMAEFNGNPNIAGVQLYFEENGTAYFVMEYLDGCSFGDYIASRGGRLSWEDTAGIMFPVLEVLGQIHAKGVVHRDVSPDNIHITADGTVKLLDFGAARHSLGNVSQSLDVVVKHGFAPKEQYSRRGRQGPYTDVYAASATIYYALTGVKPDESIDRAEEDTMPPPSILGAKITQQQEDVLMKGLAVKPEDRYQSAKAFTDALTPEDSVVGMTAGSTVGNTVNGSVDSAPKESDKPQKTTVFWRKLGPKKIAAAAAALLLLAFGIFWFAHPHSYGGWVVTAEATCLDTGLQERKCFCGKTEALDIDALGHTVVTDKAVAATCTEPGKTKGSHCTVCGETLVQQFDTDPIGHNVVIQSAVDPTCSEPGLTEGLGCENCDYAEIPQQQIEILGHTPVTDPAVEATCIAEGKTEGSHCSVCNEVLVEQQTLEKTDHRPVKDNAVAATCSTEGKSEGSHCSTCGTVLAKQTVTEGKKAHNYANSICTYCGKRDPNSAWVTCTRCSGSGDCQACKSNPGWCAACDGMGAWFTISPSGESVLNICETCHDTWYCTVCGGNKNCTACGGNGGYYS